MGHTLVAAFALLAGCENAVSLALEIPPQDLAALVFLPAGGEVRALSFRAGEPAEILLEEGDRAYVFVVAHRELTDLSRAALPLDATGGADVRLADDPPLPGKGACGFCVFPAQEPPQRVAPGDSCPLPPFARVFDLAGGGGEVDAEPFAEVRSMILVDWPGTCP